MPCIELPISEAANARLSVDNGLVPQLESGITLRYILTCSHSKLQPLQHTDKLVLKSLCSDNLNFMSIFAHLVL